MPATVKLLDGLDRVKPAVKVARPLLPMVRRSMSWELGVAVVLPVALVLKTRLPPRFPEASCKGQSKLVTYRRMLTVVQLLAAACTSTSQSTSFDAPHLKRPELLHSMFK